MKAKLVNVYLKTIFCYHYHHFLPLHAPILIFIDEVVVFVAIATAAIRFHTTYLYAYAALE